LITQACKTERLKVAGRRPYRIKHFGAGVQCGGADVEYELDRSATTQRIRNLQDATVGGELVQPSAHVLTIVELN
jgi:hypothetical protein